MIRPTDRDTIVEEIHRTRRAIAERFGGDVTAMLDDARRRQAESGRPVWRGRSPERVTESKGDQAASGPASSVSVPSGA